MAAIEGKWYASIGTHAGDAYPQGDDTVRFVYADQPDGTKYIVAKVWADDAGDYESTARLVAAAPELLHACRAVANDLNRMLDGDDSCGMSDTELFTAFLTVLEPALDRALDRWDDEDEDDAPSLGAAMRAALAKAEGRGDVNEQ